MSAPINAPKTPIPGETAAELDEILYELSEMLSRLSLQEVNEILITLRNAFNITYIPNERFESDLLVLFSIRPFQSEEENKKFRELLTKLLKIMNKNMPPLLMKRVRLVNYVINTIFNIVRSLKSE